jgi:hypothetical protein
VCRLRNRPPRSQNMDHRRQDGEPKNAVPLGPYAKSCRPLAGWVALLFVLGISPSSRLKPFGSLGDIRKRTYRRFVSSPSPQSGLLRRWTGPSSDQRAVHQMLELVTQFFGMRVQILNYRTHCFPAGNWGDTGFGGFFEYSCHVPSTETSP